MLIAEQTFYMHHQLIFFVRLQVPVRLDWQPGPCKFRRHGDPPPPQPHRGQLFHLPGLEMHGGTLSLLPKLCAFWGFPTKRLFNLPALSHTVNCCYFGSLRPEPCNYDFFSSPFQRKKKLCKRSSFRGLALPSSASNKFPAG